MMSPITTAKIYSIIGNPSSLAPLALKDISNSIGMTAGSMVTGKEEGIDRSIDEFGTEGLWLCAIPGYKGLINLLGFKTQGLDYNFDARNFRNPKLIELIKKYCPEDLKENVNKVVASETKFKKLAAAKFGLSVSLAIASYIGLTKLKQKYTDKQIRKNILAEQQEKMKKNMTKKKQKENELISNPAFAGIGKVIQDFACDPVKNMWCLDGGITTERIVDSRGKQERWGYGFKEGTYLFFMYYAGNKWESILETRHKKNYNKTIGFDARVIENPEFRNAFESGKAKEDLIAFSKVIDENIKSCSDKSVKKELLMTEELNIYKFIQENKENLVVKTAIESDMVKTYKKIKPDLGLKDILTFSIKKDTGKIDTRKFIDMEDIKAHYEKLNTLLEEFQTRKAGETSEEFFGTLKRLKRGAIINNIGIGILVLGIITPSIMLMKRLLSPNDKEFCRKKELREQMIKDGEI